MDKLDEIMTDYAAKLAVHLYTTHGYPVELFQKQLEKMTYGQLLSLARKHRDFVKQIKNENTFPSK